MNQQSKDVAHMIMGVATLAGAILLGIALNKAFPPVGVDDGFGVQQTPEAVTARYSSCKAHAPKGMDCVMIPMLVSDEFMRKYGEK